MMKKNVFLLILLCVIGISVNAQTNQKALVNDQKTEVIAGISNTNDNSKEAIKPSTEIKSDKIAITEQNNNQSDTQNNTESNKKRRGDIPVWKYVVGGVVVVAIVIVSILAPNGYNSRTGI